MKERDMTDAPLFAALKRDGLPLALHGFLGYGRRPNGVHASYLNGGNRRRQQLAYILRLKEENGVAA